MATDALDYGSDKIATHTVTEDAVEKHIERIAAGAGVAGAWDDTATVTATGLVSGLSVGCAGKGRIIIGALCETTENYFFTFRLVFKNSAGTVMGLSAAVSPVFTALTDGGSPAKKYAANVVFANDVGASTVEMYVTALPVSATTMTINMSAI